MMNKKIKSKWVKALRSGKYNQTRKILRDDRGYCCLGVLCDIVEPDSWEMNNTGMTHKGQLFLPDSTFRKKCGIDYEEATDLSKMNDKGNSFPYIADYIESLM